jgi:HK97 family phage major capsid protein
MRTELDALMAKEDPSDEDFENASKMNEELEQLEKKEVDARKLEEAQSARKKEDRKPLRLINTGGDGPAGLDYEKAAISLQRPERKSWWEGFIGSTSYKSAREGGYLNNFRVELPDVFGLQQKAAGDPITTGQFSSRTTDYTLIPHPWGPTAVLQLVNVTNVTAAFIRYYQATVPLTNTAAFIAEATAKPEIQPRWAPVDAPIETVADWTAVTLQALEDVPQLRDTIDFDLRRSVEVRVDDQILNGNGTSPQLKGILGTTGVQSIAFVATTSAPDMIAKGISAIVAGGYGTPSAIVMNPADWWATRVSKNATTGLYYFGAPSDPGAASIYGIPVVQDPNLAAGTALVGDWSYATLYQRIGITFIVGLKNDDLIKNLQTIVCEMRCALAVRRPGAFAKVALV